ncbi:receptor-like serine/threonine-protein kinase SD1-8 isoform X2 [Brachypodium distachyon]|uniref:receptor-like serine/threonine-protein kinase SD1-8 isoform X2 n=1 Tax=Brachypodium distachyon TaxID=15368 RepID=UPI00071D7A4E|nr:receptor-like serine/threonine-protein kinase SD1-8 isoform X2 [Brachypodium distachyon]|eukprot:XP_024311507.1 receptor-like serine/threonine-protein kinase SD1-8 isoform X2 [Brachypodium distachyon]
MFPNFAALLVFSVLCLLSLVTSGSGSSSSSSDTLNDGRRNITDGQTLVSAGGTFTLGFFSPGTPSLRYLGIWFSASTDAVVWLANRDSPLNDTAGVLTVNAATGILLLLDGSGRTAWSSSNTTTTNGNNSSSSSAAAVQAQLLESGNLVLVRGTGGSDVLWQSFDHPSNTLIAGMRLGVNPQTGAEWALTSWKYPTDPSTGDCRRAMDTRGLPDCVSWRGGAKKYRTGPWNGLYFSGVPEMASYSDMFTNEVVVRPDEVAYVFDVKPSSASKPPFSRLVLGEAGVLQRLVWDPASKVWNVFAQAPRDVCDEYGRCGKFGLCDVNTPSTLFCGCVAGFGPVDAAQWAIREASGGCRRNVPLDCRAGGGTTDGFKAVRGVKLPDTDNTTVDMAATVGDCRARCLANCSCVAFAAADISGGGEGSGCVMWVGDIVDVRYVDKGQDLYVRLAKSELVNENRRGMLKILLPVTACLLVLACIFLVWICKFRGMRSRDIQKKAILSASTELGDENIELPFFSFRDIVTATEDFSNDNMLGQGGFGKVYKGMLEDDKEVAIKRLSKNSGQGAEEFRNEVVLIAKLQHRNLVRLLGYCIHGDERLLIYEYLPNKSLDVFIFDPSSKHVLDWSTRSQIIKGVARGLLYLHQDSRLTIIHRDLKSSNILLDVDMSPKISDFGMARIFGRDQQEANTNRVVGTYGYMSPEYAMDGAFSVKSDTYSFGVILLEIISGLKISLPRLSDFPNLLAYAWNLWKDGKPMDMVDSSIVDKCSPTEVLRCIHIGLLCVQDNPNNRPLMSSVVFMLENETTTLSTPKQPVYFAQRNSEAKETEENTSSSMNNMSLTVLEGR